jgi:hypothetical protein
MDISPRRRHTISTLLAIFLAVESVSAVAAAAGTSIAAHAAASATAHALPAASPVGLVFAATGAVESPAPARIPTPAATPAPWSAPMPVPAAIPAATPAPAPRTTPKAIKPATKPAPRAATKPAPRAVAPRPKLVTRTTDFAGRNHVWIPGLGINRSVSAFSCSRTRSPDNFVYRWGCAGANNVYLLGHAASVFRSLHDAYVNGSLRVGMRAWYADGSGTVHQYSVRWWRLTRPTTDAAWAWAAQAVPSMTLQTCVGAHSEYRLMVRLVEVGG